MKHPDNFRNVTSEPSPYFQGRHCKYGRYQWNIKFYGWFDEFEVEQAVLWAFGEHGGGGFEGISEYLGRKIDSSIEGRSGGWLVIDSELSPIEVAKVDRLVYAAMKSLPDFLEALRAGELEVA